MIFQIYGSHSYVCRIKPYKENLSLKSINNPFLTTGFQLVTKGKGTLGSKNDDGKAKAVFEFTEKELTTTC
jgi:hypothetical protein